MQFHNVSRHVCGRCLTKHIADKGVTWRRVALTKKRWGEKRKHWRKNGKQEGKWRRKEEEKEKERLGRSNTIPQTSLEFCQPCSNRLGKNKKMRGKIAKNAHHDRTIQSHQHDKPSTVQFLATKHKGTTWDRQRSCKIDPNNCEKNTKNATKLTAQSSHHCT